MGGSPSVFCALYQKKLLWENMLSITITQKMRNYVYLCRMKQLVFAKYTSKSAIYTKTMAVVTLFIYNTLNLLII